MGNGNTSPNISKFDIPVVFLPAGLDACALYRMFQPHMQIPGSTFMLRLGALDVTELNGYKVAMVQRQVGGLNLDALKKIRAAGIKIVYDLDDDIWSLPAANPGKQAFDSLRDEFAKCALEAHILTVSTRGLESTARFNFRLGKEIVVVPNAVDLNLFHPKELVENNGLVIMGWGGSNTHNEDVAEAFSVIPDVLTKNPNLRMEIVGAPALDEKIVKTREKLGYVINAPQFNAYRHEKVVIESDIHKHPQTSFRPWVPVAEYPMRLASWAWDFFLAPLAENRFNRSKSCIKMLEAAALKVPCLASDVQPYREFAELGGSDLVWLLCQSPKDWTDKITVLANDHNRRKELGEKMYRVCARFYNAEKIAESWKRVFQKVLAA